MNAKDFFTEEERKQIVDSIKQAEFKSSGEIKVHIENTFKGEVLDRAAQVFKQLEMHKTELRNGVLIYLAIKDRKFAVIGDAGINKVVGNNFWDEAKDLMLSEFKNQAFAKGLCEGISKIGEQLTAFFPRSKDDLNELSDDISFGK